LVQKIGSKERIFAVNASAVPIEDLKKKGADKVKVRYLIDERHGSNRFALRLYEVEKEGCTPLDQHEYEHQVYVLSGRGLLRETEHDGLVLRELREGDAVFVPSNAVHQFMNERDEPFVFLCVKGDPRLYGAKVGSQEQTAGPQDSTDNFC
jgi:quercetin dioxygenase-like cupin family protein